MYEKGRLREVFAGPSGADTVLYTINYGPGGLWAGGSKNGAGWLLREQAGNWEELAPPRSLGVKRFVAVFPVRSDVCWFEGEGEESETGIQKVLLNYAGGVWNKVLGREFGHYRPYLCVTTDGTAFKYDARAGGAVFLISGDNGVTWVEERLPSRYGDLMADIYDAEVAAAGNDVYIVTEFTSAASRMKGEGLIRRRAGAAGGGHYEVAFFSPRREELRDLRFAAFRGADDGYVVGLESSVRLKGGEWLVEDVIAGWFPNFEIIAAGPRSYWAAVNDSEIHPHEYVLYEAPN